MFKIPLFQKKIHIKSLKIKAFQRIVMMDKCPKMFVPKDLIKNTLYHILVMVCHVFSKNRIWKSNAKFHMNMHLPSKSNNIWTNIWKLSNNIN